MTTSNFITGKNDGGEIIRQVVVATGDQDGAGQELWATAIARAFSGTGVLSQVSTAGFVDVVDSDLDARFYQSISYTITNTGANSIDWKVLAANNPDFSDSVEVKASAAVAAAAKDSYSATVAVYSYYKVQIKDDSGGSHGTGQVAGITKG